MRRAQPDSPTNEWGGAKRGEQGKACETSGEYGSNGRRCQREVEITVQIVWR